MNWNPDEIPGHTSWLIGENRPRALHEYVGYWKDNEVIDKMLGTIANDMHYTQFTNFIAESKSIRERDLGDYFKRFIIRSRDAIAKYRESTSLKLETEEIELEEKKAKAKIYVERLKNSHLHEFGCKFWDYAKEGRINNDKDELMRCTCLYKEL